MRSQTHHAVQLIVAERDRQVDTIGYDARHDDAYREGQLARAAAAYATASAFTDTPELSGLAGRLWPWRKITFRPGNPVDRKSSLIKAGALIIAELERLERAGA